MPTPNPEQPHLITHFAPAARAPRDVVARQADLLRPFELLKRFLDVCPYAAAVLNGQRQIVLCNRALVEIVGAREEAEVLGRRLGEALGCKHATEMPCGCGTTEFCRTCGAVSAILSGLVGRKDARECRLTRRINGSQQALELLVSTSPVWVQGEQFIMCTLVDISHEKRRHALERIFLHDLAGELAEIEQSARGLREAHKTAQVKECAAKLVGASRRLVAEISNHRELLAAEAGELSIAPSSFQTLPLLRRLADQFPVPAGRNCTLEVDPAAEDLTVITDLGVVHRILLEMIKNAVEASGPGDPVTLGCRKVNGQIEYWVHNREVMPREVQLQVFQRSFSTKAPTRGLGTYSLRLLGEQYLRGEVSFRSAEGEGTTFFARFPNLPPC